MTFLKNAGLGAIIGGPVGGLIGAGLGLFGSALGLGKKKSEAVKAMPQATRDDAVAMISQQDELRKRKGGAADILNGVTGAEAALSGGKLVLGS